MSFIAAGIAAYGMVKGAKDKKDAKKDAKMNPGRAAAGNKKKSAAVKKKAGPRGFAQIGKKKVGRR